MPRARYKQLVDQFASRIRSGELSPGTQLPTHRQLAAREGLALVTASRVYAELEQMGLVSGETGRGTFVRETALPLGHGIDQPPATEGMIDLNFNSPSIPGQTDMLRQALRQLSISGDLESLLHYQPHAGRQHERAIVATHLEQRGLKVSAEQVFLVSGAQHGLAATVMSLLQPGDVVAVDALTYSGFKVLAEVHRLELVAVAVTDRLDNGLSAVYTFYDPELGKRSPGVFTLLWQIEHCRQLGLDCLYLGFWIAECRKMSYKDHYRPCEILTPDGWRPLP